jgi:hypothetical protein
MSAGNPPLTAVSSATRKERKAHVFYWVSTGLLVAQLTLSACLLIARPPIVTTVVQHLGYPGYFPIFLGLAKLLAAIAILQPWFATLKEWAYAGATFDLLAASLSHFAVHDAAKDVAGPWLIMILVAASYFAYLKMKRSVRSGNFQRP